MMKYDREMRIIRCTTQASKLKPIPDSQYVRPCDPRKYFILNLMSLFGQLRISYFRDQAPGLLI